MQENMIAVILGLIEGLTEFLPVSSTGHLILTADLLDFTGEKAKTFEIFIQLGAILGIALYYWRRILDLLTVPPKTARTKKRLTLIHVIIAILPAVIMGLLFHKFIKNYLFSPYTVIIGLVVGGLFMVFAERKQPPVQTTSIDEITYRQALSIGLFQCLALWPGFSRSGSTIAGGLLVGVGHKAAADFTFLIAIPIMFAASGLDLLKSYQHLAPADMGFFMTGFFVSFVVAFLAVRTFPGLIERFKLTPFAYYRFALAAVAFLYFVVWA